MLLDCEFVILSISIQVAFKRLYKNISVRERGTLAYFREKLQRRNVSIDVKHYEDCEQFFISVGKCYLTEALLQFFELDDTAEEPASFNVSNEELGDKYASLIDKFVAKYFLPGSNVMEGDHVMEDDGVMSYAVHVIKFYLIITDVKDAVSTGNGDYLATLHKQLLVNFFSTSGFNAYAIEMLVNIIQNEVLLSEAEAHQCKLAAVANWHGGCDRNMEIDLFQEIRNKGMKGIIQSMGANKTEKAIGRASKASSGVRRIVEAFDC